MNLPTRAIGSRTPDVIPAARQTVTAFLASADREHQPAAPHTRLDPRVLLPRLLLRGYRLTIEALLNVSWAQELTSMISTSPFFFLTHSHQSCTSSVDLRASHLAALPEHVARVIHERRHYLGSFHAGTHLGLVLPDSNRPLSLVTLSPLDVQSLILRLPPDVEPSSVMVLSRLYSLLDAPKNTLSFTLSKTFQWLRTQRPVVKLLLTYLDRNLGFSGSIYRATNWHMFGHELKQAYLYLDGEYVTHRELKRRFGTYEWSTLLPLLGDRISRSSIELAPLDVYAFRLDSPAMGQRRG